MKPIAAVLAALVLAPVAYAEEWPIRGLVFAVTDPLPGVNPSRRHISVRARGRVSAPFSGDPLVNGATLRVFANGAVSTTQTFVLPGGAFQEPNGPGWSGTLKRHRASYRYVDERGDNGPVTGLAITQLGSHLRIVATVDGRGNAPDIEVVPPDPGTDGGLILAINGGDTYCVLFGGAVRGKIRDNDAEAFRVAKPRTQACPDISSPSAAFVD
jgi:hypothetical protein